MQENPQIITGLIPEKKLQDFEQRLQGQTIEIHEAYKYIYKHYIDIYQRAADRGRHKSNWKRFITWICTREGITFQDPMGEIIIQYSLTDGVKKITWTGEDKYGN